MGTPSTKKETPNVLQRVGLFFHDKRETTLVFWIAIVVFGFISYTALLQRQGFPNVDVPISVVSGTYFVNDAARVDADVSLPLAKALLQIPEVKSVSSQSGAVFYSAVVRFNDGVSSANGNALVEKTITQKQLLPKNASVTFKAIDAGRFAEQSDMLVSVSSDNYAGAQQLQDDAARVAKQLATIEGVKNASVLKQVESGVDPATNQIKTQISSFDTIATRDGSGAIIFRPSVIIGVQAQPTTDALQLYDAVTNKIDILEQQDEFKDTRIVIAADFAEGIREQISSLQQSLLEGLVVVIIVSCLLISIRAGIVTALSMITVLFATIGVLYGLGLTLNTITLFGLILSLGLIVDDTTIMVEAIDAGQYEFRSRRKVVAMAIKRVARASFAGTITTMLAFAPMLFISGILGDFIRVLPLTIIIALAVSLLVSLTLVPFLARIIVAKKKHKEHIVTRIEKRTSNALAANVLAAASSKKKRLLYGGGSLLIAGLLTFASFPLFLKLKFDIFPSTKDSNTISVQIVYPDGITIDKARQIADDANIIIGNTLGKNIERITYQNTGNTVSASATITLISFKSRDVTSQQMLGQLDTEFKTFTQAHVSVSQVDAGPGKDDYPFAIQIFGDDAAKSYALASDMQKFLQDSTVTRLDGSTAKIIRTSTSHQTLIARSDGKKYVEVRAGFSDDDVSALVVAAQKLVNDTYTTDKLATFGFTRDDIKFDFGSESNNQDSFKSMLLAFPVLLLVMYILLVLQFKSFLQPLLIFSAIPFSFFGVALGLKLTNNPLSFFVLVGFFALIGIALNNTILLTDYANQAMSQGMNRYQAVALAVRTRFRPLIATSLTSIVALIPLALTDPFWQSLSVTLIFGLLSSTFLVIIAFPYYYLVGEWLRDIGRRGWHRQLKTVAQVLFDVVTAPLRVVSFMFWIVFSWRK